ncbi:MAG TPA: YfdX family protein, partial [Gammaproteobacteria bacterium]|nr:YfdX family protein [Gammaproteobacteria bacterium]
MKNLPRFGLLSLLVAAMLVATVTVTAQTVPAVGLHEEVSVVPGRTVSRAEERIISRSAARVLRHIANARAAIHAEDLGQARVNLEQARTLLEIIRSVRPTASIIDHIWAAKKQLDYRTSEEVGLDLVPIDAELVDIADILPVEQARKHLGKARQYLKKGKKAG